MPERPLPFPSLVVASQDDPYVAIDRAWAFARSWGARFIDLGRAGHINPSAGYGPWASGKALLGELVEKIQRRPSTKI